MYNEYYLSSIDSKLDSLNTLINQNNTIIEKQDILINDFKNFNEKFDLLFIWFIILMFAILFYHFYKNCFKR